MELVTYVKLFFKTITLAFLGACIIGFVEMEYFEDTFYSFGRINTPITICPKNWEAKFYSNLWELPDKAKTSDYSAWDKIKDTPYQHEWKYFVNNDTEEDTINTMKYLAKKNELCNIQIKASPEQRILFGTIATALQPIHLILGWVLIKSLITIGNFLYLYRPKYFLSLVKRVGYIFRGIYRKIVDILNDYEKKGK